MPRPSGFTDAELAAAAWRRNLKNGGTNVEETEVRSRVSGYLAQLRCPPKPMTLYTTPVTNNAEHNRST